MYYTLIKALLYIALVAVFMFLFYWIYILYNTYKQEDRIPPIVLEIEDVIRNIGKRVFDNIITPSVKAIFRFFKWLFSESTRNKILGFFKCLLLGILELFKLLFSIIFGWLFSDSTPNNEGTAASQQKKQRSI